ncbi:hypothetical protein [uncultured Winogradskyella sp.]|uniref:hypothetical protein n=1 Tax=uncultured Winogradskyella sp. TaxID=395353 RepID=UPI0026175895|nr:hypothetical protein [uncultured Winogradskyella sp.]
MPKKKKKKKNKSWLVHFWSQVFRVLSYISIFTIIRRLAPKKSKSYSFVEYYVTFNTLLSIITLLIVTYRREYDKNLLLFFVMCFGFFRTFEIIIYQINVLLFDEYRAKLNEDKYAVRSYRRMVLLLLHNYIEIICWFGVAYMWFYRSGHISLPPNSPELTFLQVFHESMLLMFSFSPSQYVATTNMGFAVFTAQAIIGLFMTLVVFARFLGLLPPPDTMDEFESDID